MQNIQQNPFRLIGTYANANQRAIKKQQGQIRAFQKVGKPIYFASDLPFVGPLERDQERIQAAFAQVEKDQSRLEHGLFWFIRHNHIDEVALTHLEEGNVTKALSVWSATTDGKEVTASNMTAFHNQGSLLLALASIATEQPATENLQKAIQLRLELMRAAVFPELVTLLTDPTFKVDAQEVMTFFSSQMLAAAPAFGYTSNADIQTLFAAVSPDLSETVSGQLTEGPMHTIEMAVAAASRVRTEEPLRSIEQGQQLYAEIEPALAELAAVAGKEDVKYITCADKAANELLQCGVAFFKVYQGDMRYATDSSLSDNLPHIRVLFEQANELAATEITQQRVQENIKAIASWEQDAPLREQEQEVQTELGVITAYLKHFQSQGASLATVRQFLNNCEPELKKIGECLGNDSQLFRQISSAVANNALGKLVQFVNTRQSMTTISTHTLPGLQQDVISAMRLTTRIGKLHMLDEHRKHYLKNKRALNDLSTNLTRAKHQVRNQSGGGVMDVFRIILFIIGLLIFLARLAAM